MNSKNQDSDLYRYLSPPKDLLALELPVPEKPKEPMSLKSETTPEDDDKEEGYEEDQEEKKEEEEDQAQEKIEEEQDLKEEEDEKKQDEAEEIQDKMEEEKEGQAFPLLFRDGQKIEQVEGTGILDVVDDDGEKMTVPILDGKKNGQALLFDEAGILTTKLTYLNDELHGPGHYMYPDGETIQTEFNFEHNLMCGPFIAWSESGLKQSEAIYKNEVIHGDYLVYDLEGEVVQIQEYKNGQQDGETRTYMPKSSGGKLHKTEYYEKGVRKWEKVEKM
jgi:antitoxin component YwqK of YwqJK toxin-antitoxin module